MWIVLLIGAIPIMINSNRVRAGLEEFKSLGIIHTILATLIGATIIFQAPLYGLNYVVYSSARNKMDYQMSEVSKYTVSLHQMVTYVEPNFDKEEDKYQFFDNSDNIKSISEASEMAMIKKANQEVFDYIKKENEKFLKKEREILFLGIFKIPYTVENVLNVKFVENTNSKAAFYYKIDRRFRWLMGY